MSDLIVPDCLIYFDADVSETEAIGLVAELVYGDDNRATGCETSVVRNEDYDSNRRRQFPGGFVYFRYYADLYMSEMELVEQAHLVAQVLEALWDMGTPAVAASPFEDRLPQRGGYKSTRVPWPRR